jgi:hypothetical protein
MVLRLSVIGLRSRHSFRLRRAICALPIEAMQRLAEIPEHVAEVERQGGPTAD